MSQQPSHGQPQPRFVPNEPERGQPYDGYQPPPGYQQSSGQPPYGYQPSPGGPQFPPPPPRKKRHWVRNTFLGILGVIVIIIIASVAASGGHSTPPASSAGNAGSTTPAAAPQAAAKIGSPVRDGKFQFTITSVSQAKSVGDTANGLGDTAQGEYTILHVTVTNIGSQPQTLDDSSQYVYDASGRKYDASTSADLDLNSANGTNSVFLNDINPGNTVNGQLAFDMPTGTKAVKAELHDSPFSGGVTVNLP
jgi:hypothetical protein